MHRRSHSVADGLLIFAALCASAGVAWAAEGDEALNQISGVEVRETDAATEIVVRCTETPTFTVFKLTDPIRLFVDVSNADASRVTDPLVVENGVVGEVSTLQYQDDLVNVARVIVTLDQNALYAVKAEGSRLVITVDASNRGTPSPAVAAGETAETSEAKARANEAEARASAAEARAREADERARNAAARAAEAERAARAARAEEAQRVAQERAAADQAAADKEAAEARADENAARAQAAEARAREAEAAQRRAEAARRQAEAELAALDAERDRAKARIAELQAGAEALQKNLEQARADNDEARAAAFQAETRARDLEEKAQEAELARIGAAREASDLRARLSETENALATARREDRAEDVRRLEDEVDRLKTAGVELEKALAERNSELQDAQQVASESRARADAAEQQAAIARAQAVPPPALPQTRITQVKFEDGREATKLVVSHEGAVDYQVRNEGDRTQVLVFRDATIPPAQERSLDTSDFPSAVQLVSSFQAPPPARAVHVVVTLSEPVKADVVASEGKVEWVFQKPAAMRPVAAVPPPPAWTPPAEQSTPSQAGALSREPEAPTPLVSLPPPPAWSPPAPRSEQPREVDYVSPRVAAYAGTAQAVSTAPRRANRGRRYKGRKINIDIKDGDIHNILRLLAKEGNINIITSDQVSGTVTMHLKNVPWDQALELILRSKGYEAVWEDEIVRVAPAEQIAKEREAELAKQQVKKKLKPLGVKLVSISHADATDMVTRVRSLLSERGTAEVDDRTNIIIVKDVDDHLDAVEDLVRRLDTQTPQVLIEARIVEVNANSASQFGIQWGGDVTFSNATGNPTGLAFPSTVGIRGGADDQQAPTEGTSTNPNFVVNLPAATGAGAGGALGFQFGSIGNAANLNLRLSALATEGRVKIVSQPRITTLDNKRASISQGVSIPISQVSAQGVQTVFFDAQLELQVTPQVTQDGNVYLELQVNNDTPDFQNVGAQGDPTILRKTANTQLLLRDGDTTVIGGIYTRNTGSNRASVPVLGDIPILGALFRTSTQSDLRTEMLIFITPRIVNRVASSVRTE